MAKNNRYGKALILSRDQIEEVIANLSYPHNAIASLCYWSASRAGEIVSLPVTAIGDTSISIRQTKTKVVKEISYCFPQIKEAIALIHQPQGQWCFPGRKPGLHLTIRAFQKQLDHALDWIGIRGASSHSFRRSMATHLYLSGVDLESIRQMTGHKTLSSLTEYIDIPRLEAQSRISEAIAQWGKADLVGSVWAIAL